jgi:hypothetical protein
LIIFAWWLNHKPPTIDRSIRLQFLQKRKKSLEDGTPSSSGFILMTGTSLTPRGLDK